MNLERLIVEEIQYRSLYEMFPEAWQEPVENWDEMVRRYHRAGITDIPGEPLSFMGEVLTEEAFFAENEQEAVCFHNLRYCPPFLHTLEFIKIIYCMRGSSVLYLNDVRYHLEAGNFCIITPGIRHTVFSGHDEDILVNILMRASSFSNAFAGILMEHNILSDFFWKLLYTRHSNRILLFRSQSDEKLDRWIERLFDESARGAQASNLLMRSYVMIFLGLVMREHLKELQTLEELTDEVYVLPAIVQYMKNNLSTVTLPELSIRFGMKETELKRYVARESGYAYNYLLRDLRLRRAAWLLQNTTESMEQIIEDVGYSNMTNFYRTFKERFHKTPHEYREEGAQILI